MISICVIISILLITYLATKSIFSIRLDKIENEINEQLKKERQSNE